MTSKVPAKRKAKPRKISHAELRRQIAAQKQRADELERRLLNTPQQTEEETLVTGQIQIDESSFPDPLYDVEHQEQSMVTLAGAVEDSVDEYEELPETRSTYTHDQVLAAVDEILARRETNKASANDRIQEVPNLSKRRQGPDIHVKQFQHAREASEMHMGKAGAVTDRINKQGDVELIKVVEDFDPKDPAMIEKQANEAFMRDVLLVQIHDTNEKFADPKFSISVNGRNEVFIRGKTKKVRRCFVEGLARAKPINFGNQEYTDDDGVRQVRNPRHIGLRYPFAVLHDPHPRGMEWLAHVIAQP
jgi:hypothetical protein